MDFTYNITTTSSGVQLTSMSTGAIIALVLVCAIFTLGAYIITSIFMGKLFQKAGVPFWKAWVPIYNQVKFLQLGGQNPLHILWAFTGVGAIVTYVFICIAAYNIDKKLGNSDIFVALYIIINIVWLGINGLNKSTWDESKGQPSLAFETKAKSAV